MNRLDSFFIKTKIKFLILFKNKLYKIKHNNSQLLSLPAISSIEMILLLLVLVSIVVIFRTQIISIVNSVFSKIKNQINAF